MKGKLNCPNCGAPITGIQCEYCGTMFYDFAEISDNTPKYLRLDFNGKKIWCKAVMRETNITINYRDDPVIIEVLFATIPDKDGTLIYFQEEKQ